MSTLEASSTISTPPSEYKFALEALDRPVISADEAAALVQCHWGLHVLSVKELGSYEDRNFLVTVAAGDAAQQQPQQQQQQQQQRVLKVTNAVHSSIPGFLEAQNSLFGHLGFHGLRCPAAEPTLADSRLIVGEQLAGGASKVRLLKFVPGDTLKGSSKSPQLLRSVGRYLARLDAALVEFWHPGIRPTHDWAIERVLDAVQQFRHLLPDAAKRAAAQKVAELFQQLVLPAAGQLRKQLIHGDANENNIIVDPASQQVAALIDWSDAMVAWLVAEVAIAAAYVLLMTMTEHQPDAAAGAAAAAAAEQALTAEDAALQAAAHVVAGYHQQQPLTDQEWGLLPVLMAGRLIHCKCALNSIAAARTIVYVPLQAGYHQQQPLTDQEWGLLPVLMAGRLMQSTLIGTYTISREPGNAAYVMPDEQERWRCLDLLLTSPPAEVAARLRAAAEDSILQAAAAAGCQLSSTTQDIAPGSMMMSAGQRSVLAAPQPQPRGMLPVKLPPFKLELYLACYEHLPLQLSRSSCQPLPLQQLLALADGELQQQWQQLELGYPPNIGSLQLRQEVSQHYPGTSPDHVLSCVPNEGIFVTMASLLSPGDVVVAMHPAYQSLLEVARSMGATVKLWSMELEPTTGQPHFSLDALRALMTPDVKCLLVNLPHNPSGWLPSRQQWQEIIDCARRVDAWLFSDEIYSLLEQQPQQQRLAPAVCAYPQRGISLGGLSKAFGLQGLRAGWLVCRDKALLAQVECVKSYITTTGPIMSELLAVVALRNEQQLVGRCAGIIQDNLATAAAFFDRWPGMFQWAPPAAGSLCLPRLITGEGIDDFCARAAAGCGVVLLPATVYDHAAASAGQHFRLGLGRTNFKEALEALEQWLLSQQ
ncbi:hypothetical protein OEZ86_009731 [Tetradesmus obliquus]|uniref:Hydroxylysine kinase n=1 Tax=Tetradesmus obliquus TaxID=3088 RepID=A0ABY8UML5_TETOB|nr:hypothetical protein OEZ85_001174 [Tetradesmus obliquus]WIA43224.1 hypothetical protein OEZ86_009731 [Tetradesmus obliquus]